MEPSELTAEELQEARQWWQGLAEVHKSHLSIWAILALYARHVLDTQTVYFEGEL